MCPGSFWRSAHPSPGSRNTAVRVKPHSNLVPCCHIDIARLAALFAIAVSLQTWRSQAPNASRKHERLSNPLHCPRTRVRSSHLRSVPFGWRADTQQPAEDPPVHVIHPDSVFWSAKGGRVHLTRNCPTLANSRPEAMLFRPVCQVCGDWRVWTQDPPGPSQAAAPKQSARREKDRPQQAPPPEDSGL